jgi:prephenate dehydratase
VAEVVRPITHCLIARDGVALEDVARVLSHPQALAQCARFLHERLPRAGTEVAASTAEAVRTALGAAEPLAAIGTRLAAELYGGSVLAEGVEDRPDNLTRFVWLAPAGTPPHRAPDKTSVVFWGFNDESPGALVGVLRELADRGVNLTKIESRPRRVQLGHYMFFADLDGAEQDPPVRDALAGLAQRVETLRVLGSYPGAAP